MYCRLAAKETDVGLGIVVKKMLKNFVKVLHRWMVREAHGIDVRKAYGTALIAQIGHIYGDRGRFCMSLMIA